MTAQTITILSVRRTTSTGDEDELSLTPGVNVIVGLKDTGKTGWLNTISYLLGDTDPVEKAVGSALSAKFDSVAAEITLSGGQRYVIERRWKEAGGKHKILVNGDPVRAPNFSTWILGALGIPHLQIPKNRYYQTWQELTWRMLFRHIYLQERFWGDIAQQQLERERHACVLQFVGAAEKVYPRELSDIVARGGEGYALTVQRRELEGLLSRAIKELVPDPASDGALSVEGVDAAIADLQTEIEQYRAEREGIVAGAVKSAQEADPGFAVDERLSDERVQLIDKRDASGLALLAVQKRLNELVAYRQSVAAELSRIDRVSSAGEVLTPLTVTQCPNCDQAVRPERAPRGSCFVCLQPYGGDQGFSWEAAKLRLDFEREQLGNEAQELDELIATVERELSELQFNNGRLEDEISALEAALRPSRSTVAAFLPEGMSAIDTRIGQAEERVAHLRRLRQSVLQRDELSNKIDQLTERQDQVSQEAEAAVASVPFDKISARLGYGMNEYLDALKAGDARRWPHQPIHVDLGETGFRLTVGNAPWTNVGASSAALVILAYQYAMLKYSGAEDWNYPGLALIDFPLNLSDGISIADKENYLIEPFIALSKVNQHIQVVVAGRAFEGLQGSNRIPLSTPWIQGEDDNVVIE